MNREDQMPVTPGTCCGLLRARKNMVRQGFGLFWVTAVIFFIHTQQAFALPRGHTVEMGDVIVEYPSSEACVITASDRAIVNFSSFDIQAHEKVRVNVSKGASILIRVLDKSTTRIQGSLISGGTVFFVNPWGIHLCKEGSLSAENVILSSLALSTHNYLNSYFEFVRNDLSRAHIANEGIIDVATLVCLSSSVSNSGITKTKGIAHIVCGDSVMFTPPSDQGALRTEVLTRVSTHSVDSQGASVECAIGNSGTIEAGCLKLEAVTAAGIFAHGISQRGSIIAHGLTIDLRDQLFLFSNRSIELSGKLSFSKCFSSLFAKIVSDDRVTISAPLKIKASAEIGSSKDILINAPVTVECGSLALMADMFLTGKGSIRQAFNAPISTLHRAAIIMQASGEAHIGEVNTGSNLILQQGGAPVLFLRWPNTRLSSKGVVSLRKGVRVGLATNNQ